MNDSNSASQCNQFCDQDERCLAAAYNESISRCDLVSCGQMEVASSLLVQRKACHNDCPLYELFRIENATGICAIIESLTDADYGMTEHVCLERCLNTPGCRGVSFTGTECNLHQCYDHVSDGNSVFYRRVCVPESENPANSKALYNLVPGTLRTANVFAEEVVPNTIACARRCRSVKDCWGANFRSMNGNMVLCRMFVTTTDGLDLTPNTTWTYLNYNV
ncbi:uncharacterized protein LOC128223068 [Mya arenaria]|uniref:uncharacterized protein LOC128223068 n=1 Tax=Mya arenaria TaxID=6604 RepID=UPI0022E64C86|nr:uncharacterized protein LOC128223068 [Mya arenaria]